MIRLFKCLQWTAPIRAMSLIEKYYGIEEYKKISETKLARRSNRYLARLEESNLLKQANDLFVRGNTDQCFEILRKAVALVPNDFKPYYMLGLIHEESGRYEKAAMSYIASAILKKNDTTLWKKALEASLRTENQRNQILALDKLFRKEPSEDILLKKLDILRSMKKKHAVTACLIELFDYYGVDLRIFEKFSKTNHINSLKKICSSLYRCIKHNKDARCEYFLRQTIYTLFKVRDWKRILRILDEYYFKENDKMHPEIRFIYIIAFYYSDDCRFDDMLSIGKLIDDVYIWKELEAVEYAYSLCECLRETNNILKAIQVAEKILQTTGSTRALHLIGDLYYQINECKQAIQCYTRVIELDPVDQSAKVKLHRIYEGMGCTALAEVFETSSKVFGYIKEVEESKKADFRYSTNKCIEIRRQYERMGKMDPEDRQAFVDEAKILIDDFFNNPFVVVRNKNFKKFTNKNERSVIDTENALIAYNEQLSRRQISDILIRISSLHGLDVDEWLYVLKNTVISLILLEKYEEATELLQNSLEVHLFRQKDYVMQLSLLGMKLYLITGNFEGMVSITRELICHYNYTSMYLLYFSTYFFPDFYRNRAFCTLQKNIQRVTRRSIKEGDQMQDERADSEESDLSFEPSSIPIFLSVNSFIPRFLQTETVDLVMASLNSSRQDINVIKAIVSIAHTKSRTLVDKMKYATLGMNCLKCIDDSPVKLYNRAKAYHYFGFYTQAETLYLKVIETGTDELRRMSIFNLSLIFRDNKSRKVMEYLLSKT